MEVSYIAAFLVGFLGGVHCVGMCGGIVGALSFGLPEAKRDRIRYNLPYLLLYNLGRLSSYSLAGAIVGGFGAMTIDLLVVRQAQLYLQLIAGLFMILLGFYLTGWWRILLRVENLGQGLWQRLEPFGRRLLPVQNYRQAFMLGIIWGWLPCGLVYSVVIWTLFSGSAATGALLMLSFGLGTLPNLLAMGIFATVIQKWIQQDWVRQAAGSVVILMGLFMLWQVVVSLFDLG